MEIRRGVGSVGQDKNNGKSILPLGAMLLIQIDYSDLAWFSS
jgi:hypothetical protein